MRYFIVLIVILSTFNLFSDDFQLWERQFSVEGGLRKVEFAGANDEFIVAYDKRHLYRFGTETSQMIDSLYFENFVLGTVVSKDGLKYYVSIDDNPLYVYDANTMKIIDTIPAPELSESAPDNTSFGFQDLNLSNDGSLLTYRYTEISIDDYQHFEFVIYDLEKRELVARFGDKERDYRSQFYNPTFTPDAETLLVVVYRPSTDFYEQENQIWFYDISEGKLITIGEKDQFKNHIGSNSEFTFIDDNKVHITNSTLPELYGFNVLNLETGLTESYYNFKTSNENVAITKPIGINNDLYLLGVYNIAKSQFRISLFNIELRIVFSDFLAKEVGRIKTGKALNRFLTYNSNHLIIYNLSDYLKIADVESVEIFSEIIISPNPTGSFVNINLNCSEPQINYQINNSEGLLINEGNYENQTNVLQIDFSSYPIGVYFLTINCNEDIKTYKIIKEG